MTEHFDFPYAYQAKALAEAQLGPAFAVATGDPRELCGELYPAEAAAVARAVSSRVVEFQAGRAAAREAMQRLGMPPTAIPSDRDRAPVWPDGLAGSISHCDTVCIAALTRRRNARSVGIDVEAATPLDDDLLDIVCTPDERDRLAARSRTDARILAKLIFSAKESVYKAQFPLSGMIFDFHGLSVDFDTESATFVAEFQSNVPPFPSGYKWRGGVGISGRVIVTSAVLAANAFSTGLGELGQ